MIVGETVGVLRREKLGADRYGMAEWGGWEREDVAPVLFSPGASVDLAEGRPEGKRIDATFHFPRGYGKSLKGCRIAYAGREWAVVGDPQPYMERNTPGEWTLPVGVEAVYG